MFLAGLRDLAISGTVYTIFEVVSYVGIGLATILTIISAIHYIAKNINLFKQEK